MIELLPHNIPTYGSVVESMDEHKKVILTQATGTGKTYVAGKFIEEHSKKPLILVPSLAIGKQWEKLGLNAEIATYQSMHKIDFSQYDLFVPDEAHHLGSEVWGKKFIESVMNDPNTRVLGLTATEIRYLDNSRDMAEELFGGIAVRGVDLAEAINKGILPTFKYVSAYYGTEEDYNEYREKCGRIADKEQSEELSRRLELCIQNQISIKEAMHENLNMKDHKIIVFLNGICEIEQAVKMFRDIFPNCECNYVSSKESTKANDEAITKYQTSDAHISILFAIDMLNEGIHIDGTDCVVMFRNTISPQIYFQQLGRALSAKSNCEPVVFDFACNSSSIMSVSKDKTGTGNIINRINRKINEKKKKIIVKTYSEELQEVFSKIASSISSKPWAEKEDNFLIENYGKMSFDEMSHELGKTKESIQHRASRLGITKKNRRWTKAEDCYLEKHYKTESKKQIAVHLQRTEASVQGRAQLLGITQKCAVWTEEKEIFIKSNAENMTVPELSRVTGIKEMTIRQYCKRNGLTPKKKVKYLDERQKEYLLQNRDRPYSELALEIGVSPAAVGSFLIKNGNKKRNLMGAEI